MASVFSVIEINQIFFGKLRIKDCKDEPYLPAKRKSISCEIEMKEIFKRNTEIKNKLLYEFTQKLWGLHMPFFKQTKNYL